MKLIEIMMIMIMAMIIMRNMRGVLIRERSWKSTPLVMGKARDCGGWLTRGELLRQKLICSLVESVGDRRHGTLVVRVQGRDEMG
jgi:hypothetical protein